MKNKNILHFFLLELIVLKSFIFAFFVLLSGGATLSSNIVNPALCDTPSMELIGVHSVAGDSSFPRLHILKAYQGRVYSPNRSTPSMLIGNIVVNPVENPELVEGESCVEGVNLNDMEIHSDGHGVITQPSPEVALSAFCLNDGCRSG